MEDMNKIRQDIDTIDLQIRELLAQRLELSHKVAESKAAAGSTTIYRADREQAILEKLGHDVSDETKIEYLAIVRKVMETSRMYQYGLLYKWNPDVLKEVKGYEKIDLPSSALTVRLSRENRPNALSAILCMIGDYGYDMKWIELVSCNSEFATFDLTISGDATQQNMRQLIFQLSKESSDFSILSVEPR